MNTATILIVQYNAQVVIPIDKVVRDYFYHLSTALFVRKVSVGDIKIPMIRIEANNQKSAKGIYLLDLASYIDDRRDAAIKEVEKLAERRENRCNMRAT